MRVALVVGVTASLAAGGVAAAEAAKPKAKAKPAVAVKAKPVKRVATPKPKPKPKPKPAAAKPKPAAAKPKPAAPVVLATTTVSVEMYEFGFKLSQPSVPRGTVTFNVVNAGQAPHDFVIERVGTDELEGGQSQTITVQLTEAGTFKYICSLPGHVDLGMFGSLSVT